MLVGYIYYAENKDGQRARQHEECAGDNATAHPVKQPPKIDCELLSLWAWKQHAEIQRVEKPLLADPFQFFNEKPVHHRNLARRSTKA